MTISNDNYRPRLKEKHRSIIEYIRNLDDVDLIFMKTDHKAFSNLNDLLEKELNKWKFLNISLKKAKKRLIYLMFAIGLSNYIILSYYLLT